MLGVAMVDSSGGLYRLSAMRKCDRGVLASDAECSVETSIETRQLGRADTEKEISSRFVRANPAAAATVPDGEDTNDPAVWHAGAGPECWNGAKV